LFTFGKLGSNFIRMPDPDPHLSKMLDPDPHTINADPKHSPSQQGKKERGERESDKFSNWPLLPQWTSDIPMEGIIYL
jgi:hypothetical protein